MNQVIHHNSSEIDEVMFFHIAAFGKEKQWYEEDKNIQSIPASKAFQSKRQAYSDSQWCDLKWQCTESFVLTCAYGTCITMNALLVKLSKFM